LNPYFPGVLMAAISKKTTRRRFCQALLGVSTATVMFDQSRTPALGYSDAIDDPQLFTPGMFCLWQLPSQSPSQMMSYVLRTPHGKVLVIDGGCAADAPYLQTFLRSLGNHVDLWILTHPHGDHIGAITELLSDPAAPTIDRMFGSFPDEDWVEKHEPGTLKTMQAWSAALTQSREKLVEPHIGQIVKLDGCRVSFLALKNLEIHNNSINNSSLVFRVDLGTTRLLFTGDLGVEGGRKLLHSPDMASKIRADYVQMAHHGQNGVDRSFYEAVAPTYALWPTPQWLWDNNAGQGKGTGPWQTLVVRGWIEELKVQANFVSFRGLQRLDFDGVSHRHVAACPRHEERSLRDD
jgi:glyoxylase-like metal-dependent hydrolase (beta-lactamase superfamily II)